MRSGVQPLTPDDRLDRAMELFAENDLPELPVVASDDGRRLLGMVRRTDVAKAYLRRVHAQASPPRGRLSRSEPRPFWADCSRRGSRESESGQVQRRWMSAAATFRTRRSPCCSRAPVNSTGSPT